MDLGDVAIGDNVSVFFLEENQRKYIGKGIITPLRGKGVKYHSLLVRQEDGDVRGYKFKRHSARFNINGELVIYHPLEMELEDVSKSDYLLESRGI